MVTMECITSKFVVCHYIQIDINTVSKWKIPRLSRQMELLNFSALLPHKLNLFISPKKMTKRHNICTPF